MATARAAPSSGSVAEPSSSSRTSEFDVAVREMKSMLVTWAEKVERFCSMDCESPMSARTASKIGMSARSAGTGIPDWAISASRPTVFRETVLPPVLGPVMMSSRRGPSSSREMGTGVAAFNFRFRSSNGWRALWSRSMSRSFAPSGLGHFVVLPRAKGEKLALRLGCNLSPLRGFWGFIQELVKVTATQL